MGTDIRLKTKEIAGGMCRAHLGRKWPLQQNDGVIETDADKLWPKVNDIESDLKAELNVLIGYTPKSVQELEYIQQQIDEKIAGIVDELVQYGRKILLANILHDSAGLLYLEDC